MLTDSQPKTAAGRKVIVIGGGLSGLTAGYRLQQAGVGVQIVEQSASAPVGRALTTRSDGFTLDRGADLLVDRYHDYFELAREVGLADALIPVTGPVGTIKNGGILTLDGSATSFLRSGLLSWSAKIRFLSGVARLYPAIKRVDTNALHKLGQLDRGSARQLSMRYFGRESTEYLIEPMVRMFNGSSTHEASAVEIVGGLALGTAGTYAMRGGAGALPEAIAAQLSIHYGATAVEVRRQDDGVAVAVQSPNGSRETLVADGCVLATMLEPAAAAYRPVADATRDLLADLSYIKLIKIQLAYSARTRTDAFIVQSPFAEDPELMGMFLDHNKCPDRAPDGHSLLSLYMDTRTATRYLDRPDEDIVSWAERRVTSLFPELGATLLFATVTRWPFMGTSNKPGFYEKAAVAYARLDRDGPVQPAGDWFTKSSQGAAVSAGNQAARDLLAHWQRSPTAVHTA